MSPDVSSTELHTAFESKIKIRPGSTITLSSDLQIPSGVYIVSIEHLRKDSSLRKSHSSIAASGDVRISTGNEGTDLLKTEVDFHREHPFMRELQIPKTGIEDGANDVREELPIIKLLLTMVSTAHIKKIRLRIKILTKNENILSQTLSSHIVEKRKNGRTRTISSSSSPDPSLSSDTSSTPSSSLSDLPDIGARLDVPVSLASQQRLDVPALLASSGASQREREDEEIDPPRTEKHIDVVEKDILVIQKNTTYTAEGIEQNNTTQISLEHTKTISESSELMSEKGARTSEKASDAETTSSWSSSSFDPSEENLVYYKEIKLKKKHIHKEKIPIQQKGKYYLVIENSDKSPITRHFSCHATLTRGEILLKESFTNDAKKKLHDEFAVEPESADLNLDIVHTNSSFGKSELQISLYMKNVSDEATVNAVHPHFRTGEVVWSVSACEVEKKKPQTFTAKIPSSGKYYIVAEKVDKIYGGLREISVNARLTEPPSKEGAHGNTSIVASVVVGGVKARPMKWKSSIFSAPAGSVVEFHVESYAIVGSIIYSLRVRKVPGLTAEEERTRKIVLIFLATFGIYYLLYMVISLLHFIQNIGITLNFLFLSFDITIGRICFILCAVWFRTNQELLMPCVRDVMETVRKILRKIRYIRDMSDGGKFDILRIFKQMSREGRMNDLRKWERQKLQTANE